MNFVFKKNFYNWRIFATTAQCNEIDENFQLCEIHFYPSESSDLELWIRELRVQN